MKPDAETIPGLLALRGDRDAATQAIVTADDAITYAELDGESREIAARLAGAGVGKGDRVGLLAPNGVEWAVHAYGVMRLGAVLVPLSTLLRPPELRAQLDIAEVTDLLLVPSFRGRDYLDDVEKAGAALRNVWVLGGLPDDGAPQPGAAVAPADDLVVLFTSGSTGRPKGCIHTHGGALRATAAGLDARRVQPDERLYIPMPFFWTGGFSGGLLSTLIAGATLLTEAEPQPETTLRFLERERVTLFRGWPDQGARLAADPAFASADLSHLRDGSLPAVLPEPRRPKAGARPNLFGMTESFGPYCGDRLDRDLPATKHGSCGRPFEGTEVRISDAGEIGLRGPNLMRTVCGQSPDEVFDADGWYWTGDRGRLDEDGYLWYEGRLDDMFKVSGASVYPSEVEAALRSVDDVRTAAVTEVDGEVGALVVSAATVDHLETAAKARLSAFKVPTRWMVTADAADLPMTPTGKVDKAALRDLLRSQNI